MCKRSLCFRDEVVLLDSSCSLDNGKMAPITLPDQSIVIPPQLTSVDEHTSTSSTCTVGGVTDFRASRLFRLPRTFSLQTLLFSRTEGYQRLPVSALIRLPNHVLDLVLNPLHAQLTVAPPISSKTILTTSKKLPQHKIP